MRTCIAIASGALVILSCASVSQVATPDVSAIYTQAVQTAKAGVAPAAQAGPTATPAYAIPPIPSTPPTVAVADTANPNVVEPGTHIIGRDMMPGLYRGQGGGDSCYWKRLKDVSGDLNSIIANDIAEGQFYIRVKDTDYALQTDCELLLLTSLPQPASPMPTKIQPGTYLVGIDLQPGTYEGQAGSDSCYWKRLSDVDGSFNSIIANDIANGQFYIQVSPSDFAITTACAVERIGE